MPQVSIFQRKNKSNDLFGAKREKLISDSGVREIFTPSVPVRAIDLLLGRDRQVAKIIEIINTPGQHVLLFGDRGVGKSSLANIVTRMLKIENHIPEKNIYKKICCSDDSFETILSAPLKDINFDISLFETQKSKIEEMGAKVKIPIASGNLGSTSESIERRKPILNASIVSEQLKDKKGILIIDEADSIKNNNDKKKIAELIKLLSDEASKFKILVVGISSTGSDLIAEHQSIQRCLGQVKLDRLHDEELWQIIKKGEKKISSNNRLQFDGDVIQSIVEISNGYPYFTHLLALKSAEEAIANNSNSVQKKDLKEATISAAEAAEAELKDKYSDAIRANGKNADLYRAILLAAAKLTKHEFTAKELREEVCKLTQQTWTQPQLGNYLTPLISDGNETIIRRLRKGIYCFNDPRFPSFVRIANCDV